MLSLASFDCLIEQENRVNTSTVAINFSSAVSWTYLFPPSHGRWHTTTSFEGGLRSSILRTDMLCGSQVRRGCLVPWKSAMSASYAKADSTDFSMPSFPQTIHPIIPAYQNITNHLYPAWPITFFMAYSAPAITVRLGSMSPPGQTFGPLGTCITFV